MNKQKTEKARLIDTIQNYMNEQQAEQLNKFINLLSYNYNKGDLMKFTELNRNVDSATPQQTVSAIQELNPNFDTFYYVVDYNQSYGEFKNLAEEALKKLSKVLSR